jgi:membrane fusion protein, heavy metal efflux system
VVATCRRTALALASVWLLACPDQEAAAPPGEAAELSPANASQASAVGRWVEVRAPRDSSLLELPAVVRAAPEASGEVSSTFLARVERVHVQVGSTVHAGDPIVEVTAPDVIQAAAAHVAASRRIAVHRERADALEALRDERLVDTSRVFEQHAALAELEAERDRALATLRAAGVDPRDAPRVARRGMLALRAPTAGVVAELDAVPGEMRAPGGPPFARIRGTAAIRVEVRTSGPWPEEVSATLHLPGERPVRLVPVPVASTMDAATGTRVHWLSPEDGPSLADGLRGTVRLAADANVWEVPAHAVGQTSDGAHVTRKRGSETKPVAVEVITSAGASALVRGDLQGGDQVASTPGGSEPPVGP